MTILYAVKSIKLHISASSDILILILTTDAVGGGGFKGFDGFSIDFCLKRRRICS